MYTTQDIFVVWKNVVSKIIIKLNFFLSIVLAGLMFGLFRASLFFRLQLISTSELILEWRADFLGSVRIPVLLVLDWISIFFVSVVAIISGRVLLYSRSYIAQDRFYRRFIWLVIIFVARMGILILRPNLVRILLGWDGLGVTSFLLVIYYQRDKSFNAGMITALTNRLGDVGLLLIIGLRFYMGSWSYYFEGFLLSNYSFWVLFLLISAASTKSAQLPFSAWLPAAIAAPTPVSSLVHSSTLVTAGVYLLIRLNYILGGAGRTWALCLLGVSTILIAGVSAMGEVDIKKIIALSTLRQLGFMFIALGTGLPVLAFFHLSAHAYFKAIIFMGAGGVIHRMGDYQDTRLLGAGRKFLPASLRVFLVGRLSLCGIPFIAGFYSKDLILELIIIRRINLFIFFFSSVATFFTVLYSLRLVYVIFFKGRHRAPARNILEPGGYLAAGINILVVPAIIGGLGISWFTRSYRHLIFLPTWLKVFILFIIRRALISWSPKKQTKFSTAKSFLALIWFLPLTNRRTLTKIRLRVRRALNKLGEARWNLKVGPKFFRGVNSWRANYLGAGLSAGALKRIWFILFRVFIFI